MEPNQTAPFGSSLIWVHFVCNISYLGTEADERAEDKSRDWWERVNSTCTYQEINDTCYEKTHSTKDSSQNETAGDTQSENI